MRTEKEERYLHKKRMLKIKRKGMIQQMKEEEQAEKEKYFPKKKISTSKAAMWYMFASCTVVQVYSMVAMWHFADLSPLITLIGAAVGEVFAYIAYILKASKENCAGGITYDMAFYDREQENMQEKNPIGFNAEG